MIKEDSKYTGEELATGKNLFASSCQFMLGVANLEQLPPDNILVTIQSNSFFISFRLTSC